MHIYTKIRLRDVAHVYTVDYGVTAATVHMNLESYVQSDNIPAILNFIQENCRLSS